jgi:hypothetical protein
MRWTTGTAALGAVLFLASACDRSGDRSPGAAAIEPQFQLNPGPSGPTLDVAGLPADALARLERSTWTRDEWTALLRVAVAGGSGSSADRPAVLGAYSISEGVLRFTPQFPFDPGQQYDVTLDPSRLPSTSALSGPQSERLTTTIEVRAPAGHPTTRVVEVYPTALELPENQLRMYIAFSAPMGLRDGSEYIHLFDADGNAIEDPFLPLEVNLWNEDRTRFTLLFDPGRVKRGILPNEEMGRSLVAGRQYTLVVDADWQDAAGQPLAAPLRREFRVGPSEERAIDPAEWRVSVPSAGTREPLRVSFSRPLDYGLLHRAVGVADGRGDRVAGDIRLEEGETRWLFTPRAPWRPGEYQLVASSILEDVAGNRIGRPFEVNTLDSEETQQATAAAVPFHVGPAAR